MVGGEIEELKGNLKESFLRIKEDIVNLNQEILELKKEYREVLNENLELRKKLLDPGTAQSARMDESLIKKIVAETIQSIAASEAPAKKENRVEEHFLKKINRNRKLLIKNRILELANLKSMSLPELKDAIVDQENLCSKATFYRYIERLNAGKHIEIAKIQEREIVVRI